MFQNLVVCVADLHEASRIAELFRLLRHKVIECTIKTVSEITESVRMIDGLSLHHIEYVDVRSECLGKGNCIYRRTSGGRGEIRGVKNALEGQGLIRRGPHLGTNSEGWPRSGSENALGDGSYDLSLYPTPAVSSQHNQRRRIFVGQNGKHLLRITVQKDWHRLD